MRWLVTGPHEGKSQVCNEILRALPDWFGIEEAIVQYVEEVESLPMFLARASTNENRVAGFLTIRRHFEHAAEIHLIAVRSEFHRKGAGRALLGSAETWLRGERVEYLQVKTLSSSRESSHYEMTRRFYEAVGFRALEEFPTLWGERNPCLLMIKKLD